MTVTNRFSKCEIKCVGDFQLTRTYKGILRKEDVRAADKDRTEMYKCFRPGDIILARVVSFLEYQSIIKLLCYMFFKIKFSCQWLNHIGTIYQRQRMSWELWVLTVRQELPLFQLAGPKCSVQRLTWRNQEKLQIFCQKVPETWNIGKWNWFLILDTLLFALFLMHEWVMYTIKQIHFFTSTFIQIPWPLHFFYYLDVKESQCIMHNLLHCL